MHSDVNVTGNLVSPLSSEIESGELEAKLEKVTVELNFMHNENDKMKLEMEEIQKKCDDEVRKKEKALSETLQKLDEKKKEYDANVTKLQKDLNEAYKESAKQEAELKVLENRSRTGLEGNAKVSEMKLLLVTENENNRRLQQQLADKETIVQKTEMALEAKSMLLDAKEEIIKNLKEKLIQNETCADRSRSSTQQSDTNSGDNLTSDDTPTQLDQNTDDVVPRKKLVDITAHFEQKISLLDEEIVALKSELAGVNSREANCGVQRCCDLIRSQVNGALANGFLTWADIQRKQQPENVWMEQAEENFVDVEVVEAKELLWQTLGENILGKIVKRKGTSKRKSDISDICEAFKKLSELNIMPTFIATSNMIVRTPIYDSDPVECKCGIEKLNGIEKTLNSLVEIVQNNKDVSQKTEGLQTAKGTNLQNTPDRQPPVPVTNANDHSNEEGAVNSNEWTEVTGSRKRVHTGRRRDVTASDNTHLVISRVKLGTHGLGIRQYLANRDIELCDISLLTKREDASFLTFKITLKKQDVEKLDNPSVLPKEWTIRDFTEKEKTPRKRKSLRKEEGPKQAAKAQAEAWTSTVSHVHNSMGAPGWYLYTPDAVLPYQTSPDQLSGSPVNMMHYRNVNQGAQARPTFVSNGTMQQGSASAGNGNMAVKTHNAPAYRQSVPIPASQGDMGGRGMLVGGSAGQSSLGRIPWSQVVQDSPNVYGADQFFQQ